MRLRARNTILSLSLLGASGIAQAQAPIEPVIQVPLPKQDDKKDDKKKDEKKAPPPVAERPPLTFPATTNPNAANAPSTDSAPSIAVSSLPPVYGDAMGTMSVYYPYLQAFLPNGQQQSVLPGQTQTYPLGTRFNQPVQTQVVRVQTGTTTRFDPQTDMFITVPVFEQRVQVTGPDAVASVGGLPVNVVRGAFKIGENDSPRPTDRVYASYNYFYDVNPTLSVAGLPITNVHRETLGFEKTFLEGNASIGMRLPLLQISGAGNLARQSTGDISVIFKYAFINDIIQNPDGTLSPGNLLSAGAVITAPTGRTAAYTSDFPVIHSTMIQPWVGYILVRGNAYAQGFTSVAVPTDNRDTTFLFNSLQLGYRAYTASPDNFLTSVTPILEANVNTPLNNRGLIRLPVGSIDVVSLTGGATFGFRRSAFMNLGCGVPVTGPRPYGIEALAQLNIYY